MTRMEKAVSFYLIYRKKYLVSDIAKLYNVKERELNKAIRDEIFRIKTKGVK